MRMQGRCEAAGPKPFRTGHSLLYVPGLISPLSPWLHKRPHFQFPLPQ